MMIRRAFDADDMAVAQRDLLMLDIQAGARRVSCDVRYSSDASHRCYHLQGHGGPESDFADPQGSTVFPLSLGAVMAGLESDPASSTVASRHSPINLARCSRQP